jgi:hypothetical protein
MTDGEVRNKAHGQAFVIKSIHNTSLFVRADITHEHHVPVINNSIGVNIFPDRISTFFHTVVRYNIFWSIRCIRICCIYANHMISPSTSETFTFSGSTNFHICIKVTIKYDITTDPVFDFVVWRQLYNSGSVV